MKLKLLTIFGLSLTLLWGCAAKKEKSKLMENETKKALVLYYSQGGTTKVVAEELEKRLGADIDSVVPVEPYDPDYDSTIQRWQQELKDSIKVAIKPINVNINDYDTIFIGSPIWGGVFSSPMQSFLIDNDLEGKTLVTFATFGSGGIESATKNLKELQPNANIIEGYGIRSARISKAPKEIERFLIENGFIKGEITSQPNFGNSHPVTRDEMEVFNAATKDYFMPLGTAINVATRDNSGVKEYKFGVIPPNGDETNLSTIYITYEDGSPVFTKVVR
ncbi:MAG: hypothetical protein J1D77_08155 [Muribaculaceae bacterium]|nr:hypothetical protein [Muribaculaceae bacterium]